MQESGQQFGVEVGAVAVPASGQQASRPLQSGHGDTDGGDHPARPVPPVAVCEVAYTTLDNGRWLRQPGRFIRWRPDRSPEDCRLEQLVTD